MVYYYTGVGSRKTPVEVCQLMTEIARKAAAKGWCLRSGGAERADQAFELGAGENKEIYLPWRGYSGNRSPRYGVDSAALKLAEEYCPGLLERPEGVRKLLARNVYQVLGQSLNEPSSFVVCYTTDGKASGGTRIAMNLAHDWSIPVFNLYHERDRKELLDVC